MGEFRPFLTPGRRPKGPDRAGDTGGWRRRAGSLAAWKGKPWRYNSHIASYSKPNFSQLLRVASGWLPVGYQIASGWLQGSLRVAVGGLFPDIGGRPGQDVHKMRCPQGNRTRR